MAVLARPSSEGPGPLEGLRPEALVRGVHAALQSGLVDDLDWLARPAAGVALYKLAAALPSGGEQRELGRRVLARMLADSADSFTAIATAMARAGGKGLASRAIRARVALVCELPLTHGINDGPLALALVTRRDLAREWVALPSTKSLPSRRLAAKLLERAAREAARRAQLGDMHALRAFESDTVIGAWQRLLADRESLVWRHVAVARGLCAAWVPALRGEIEDSLKEGSTPTEWRRGATSLAAFGAIAPSEAIEITNALVERGLFTWEDPASASAFVWGMPRTIEAEPEAAATMLHAVMGVTPPEIAEAIAELRFEHGPSDVVERAEARALELLRRDKRKKLGQDDGADALFQDVARDLEPTERDDPPLRDLVAQALGAFATDGARAANERARALLGPAKAALDALEAVAREDGAEGSEGKLARRTSMAVLRDLDLSLHERSVVADLLELDVSVENVRTDQSALDAVRERFAAWVVSSESSQDASGVSTGRLRQPTLRLRRLRALLHLVDGEIGDGDDVVRADRLRTLWLRTVKALLDHFDRDPVPVLRRTVLASLARALDALVHLEACDVAEALLLLAQRIRTTRDMSALAEASMHPDLRLALSRYAAFLLESDAIEAVDPASTSLPPDACLHALQMLADEIAPEASARTEAFRVVLVRLREALEALGSVGSLNALSGASGGGAAEVVEAFETEAGALAQMCAGANGRFDPQTAPRSTAQRRLLSAAITRALSGADQELRLGPALEEITSALPHGIARLVVGLLSGLTELPLEGTSPADASIHVTDRLPAWLSARRTIGGFFVVRSLGIGGAGSVLVVNRVEDRHDPGAERFALKVPDYNATAARSVSQEQFLELFRHEASALITLPNHTHLARFVTFDLAARPLPILVMELIEGVTLERLIDTLAFDMKRCLKALDDVLAGLEAMHEVGTGHLDLKPANVILRGGNEAVLVDFGLAGRNIRTGCGTGPYGAPEVWGVVPDGHVATPPAADVYSFACLAFEMLTATVLFDAPNEVAQIAMHVAHDGAPEPMRRLAANPAIAPLAELLGDALRRDPRERPSAADLRREIRSVARMVEDAAWPIALDANVSSRNDEAGASE
jgi:hypothetical protein